MVIASRTQQLLKSSKNVTISKTLNYSTITAALGLRNYGDRNSPSQNDASGFKKFHSSWENRALFARLTPQEVDDILRANEYTHEFSEGSVKSYDSNQLAANSPIEDTRAEASCLITSGILVGVFDGHREAACAQVIAKRLFQYIAASLLPHDHLTEYVSSISTENPMKLVESYNNKVQLVDDLRKLYRTSFHDFVKDLVEVVGNKQGFEMSKALETAFLRLDADLSKEALPNNGEFNTKTLSVAVSGAVVCVAHIDGPHVHVANVGDCCAVLGSLSDTNSWLAKKLTQEHNIYNKAEVERIDSEHPVSESNTVIRDGRLLGQLAPLRAMGDYCYKWSKQTLELLVAKHLGSFTIPPNYHTPPYLSAVPDVTHHRLTPRDKFMVIASDGLWDFMSPLEVVRLVGEHMSGKLTLSPLKLPRKSMKLSEINELLLQRKEGLKTKPKDTNAATHLIRNALGGIGYGINHASLSDMLSCSPKVARFFRDDITISVVYFNSEYLRHCPP